MRCRSSPAWRSAASSSVSRTGWSATSSSAARMRASASHSTRKERSSSCASPATSTASLSTRCSAATTTCACGSALPCSSSMRRPTAPRSASFDRSWSGTISKRSMPRSAPSARWWPIRNTQNRERSMGHWFSKLYASIDAMQLDEFAAGLAPDVKVVVGNHPAMNGRQAAKEGIGYFFSTIDGIKHHLVNVAESNGLTFLEANVEYLRKDGKTVTIPVVTVLERSENLVKSLRIYFDVAPVYA